MRFLLVSLLLCSSINAVSPCLAQPAADGADAQMTRLQQETLKLMEKKDYKEAEARYRELVAMARKNPGPRSLNLYSALLGWSQALDKLDRGSDSWKAVKEANQIIAGEYKKAGISSVGNSLEFATNQADSQIKQVEQRTGSMNGSLKRARDSTVLSSMRTVQIAVESYRTDNGRFPTKLDTSFKSYFPGGGCDGKTVGEAPRNFFTKKREWPSISAPGVSVRPSPGLVAYVVAGNGKSYSIYGFDESGKYLVDRNSGKPLVLVAK